MKKLGIILFLMFSLQSCAVPAFVCENIDRVNSGVDLTVKALAPVPVVGDIVAIAGWGAQFGLDAACSVVSLPGAVVEEAAGYVGLGGSETEAKK
jgi:hypothetical protein